MCSEEMQDTNVSFGESAHMTTYIEYFLLFEPFLSPKQVKIGNNRTFLLLVKEQSMFECKCLAE